MIIHIKKLLGETPNDLIKRFREENKEYQNEKISFAGRLDPMASGAMILLTGEDCKQQPDFTSLSKKYSFKLIRGVITDTNDILGIPKLFQENGDDKSNFKLEPKKFTQEFPIYSSRVVKGYPLWWWAKNDRLDEIEIPSKECEIYSVHKSHKQTKIIHNEILIDTILSRIDKLPVERHEGFRVNQIISSWKKLLENKNKNKLFEITEYEISVSSGTYIRGICNSMGGTAMDIHRLEFY